MRIWLQLQHVTKIIKCDTRAFWIFVSLMITPNYKNTPAEICYITTFVIYNIWYGSEYLTQCWLQVNQNIDPNILNKEIAYAKSCHFVHESYYIYWIWRYPQITAVLQHVDHKNGFAKSYKFDIGEIQIFPCEGISMTMSMGHGTTREFLGNGNGNDMKNSDPAWMSQHCFNPVDPDVIMALSFRHVSVGKDHKHNSVYCHENMFPGKKVPFSFSHWGFHDSGRWDERLQLPLQHVCCYSISLSTQVVSYHLQQSCNGTQPTWYLMMILWCHAWARSDAVARISANGSAAFNESCTPIGWNSCDSVISQ